MIDRVLDRGIVIDSEIRLAVVGVHLITVDISGGPHRARAGRARVVGQVMAESLLLTLAGGALGLLFARVGLDAILAGALSALRSDLGALREGGRGQSSSAGRIHVRGLTAIGVYGVVSYSVGLRMALGARRGGVVGLVVSRGMVMVLIGVAIGLLAAAAASRLLAGMIFGVSPDDPAVFARVALLIAAVALLASYVPARRASRVDPMIALRAD